MAGNESGRDGTESYLRELYAKAIGGDREAFRELDGIAFGRNDIPLARELIREFDTKGIHFSEAVEERVESSVIYALKHPGNFLRARFRQVEVSIEHAQPPVESNLEDFPNLPVAKAAKLLNLGSGGGVQQRDWPESVKKDMSGGKIIHPDGRHPEHPNV